MIDKGSSGWYDIRNVKTSRGKGGQRFETAVFFQEDRQNGWFLPFFHYKANFFHNTGSYFPDIPRLQRLRRAGVFLCEKTAHPQTALRKGTTVEKQSNRYSNQIMKEGIK
jgi:hypothetical protein